MRIKLQFGINEPLREIGWWKTITEFPNLVLYRGNKWEFVMYREDDTGESDYIFIFGEIRSYDPNWHATTYENIDYMFNSPYSDKCECGAIFTSFPNAHMFMCKKWKKF